MSSSTLSVERRTTAWLARGADYVELTKPRIAMLVLVTVAVASFVACWGVPNPFAVLNALIGTLLVSASASALNQWLERRSDARMERTAERPLPAGRLAGWEVLLFGAATVVAGLAYLLLTVNLLTTLFALATWLVYVWVYTPLKSRTTFNTAVGAVAGALPMLIGWSAAGGSFAWTSDPRGAAMFLILFLWQFPHFMAIAWMYRQQYAAAELKMLTVVDPSGLRAGLQAIAAALALLPVSLVPAWYASGSGAVVYLVVAFLLGTAQLVCAGWFLWRLDHPSARLLLRASLVYLPALLALLLFVPWM